MESQELKEKLRKSYQVIQKLEARIESTKQDKQTAILGVSCKLPEKINKLDDFWDFLINKGNSITEYPKERLELTGYTENEWGNVKGGFIKDIEQFDPAFFKIGLNEARAMDPQHRLLLELAWNAFEDSQLNINDYAGKKVGVFIALSNNDYSMQRLRQEGSIADSFDFTGNILATAAGRIAYTFDFRGPCFVVDSACSSSLVALHQAHNALNNKECDLALVGGINLIFDLQIYKSLDSIGALSPDGYCKPLDSEANGYSRSEGGGMLILKRYEDVIISKDLPYCFIKGSNLNHDGHSNGFTAPSGRAQELVIEGALNAAGINKDDIDYVELHGTGTIIGDPIEVEAIQNVFLNDVRKKPLYIGSVKSNLGHLECAAGLAGIFKTILILNNKKIPPTVNINNLNPLIEWRKGLEVVRETVQLNEDEIIRAGISSFGISGTNVHVILESAPAKTGGQVKKTVLSTLLISAANLKSIKSLVASYILMLGKTSNNWNDICYCASLRPQWQYRIAVTASSCNEAIEKLKNIITFDIEVRRKKILFSNNSLLEIAKKSEEHLNNNNKIRLRNLLGKGSDETEEIIALLFLAGIDCEWKEFLISNNERVYLPGYQFDKIKCWTNKVKVAHTFNDLGTTCNHPVFKQKLTLPGEIDCFSYIGYVSFQHQKWVTGHQIFDTVVYPGSGFLEWMLYVASDLKLDVNVNNLWLHEPFKLKPESSYTVWLKAEKKDDGFSCKAFTRVAGDFSNQWLLHAECDLKTVPCPILVDDYDESQLKSLNVKDFYLECNKSGISYSDLFAFLNKAEIEGFWLKGQVSWDKYSGMDLFSIHPALLDNCFQLLGAYVMNVVPGSVFVPYKFDYVMISGSFVKDYVDVLIRLPHHIKPDFQSLKVDIYIKQHNQLKAVIRGFSISKVVKKQEEVVFDNDLKDSIYEEYWIDSKISTISEFATLYKTVDFSESLDKIDKNTEKSNAFSIKLIDQLALSWCAYILNELFITNLSGKVSDISGLMAASGVSTKYLRLFERILSVAISQNWITIENNKLIIKIISNYEIDKQVAYLKENYNVSAELDLLCHCAENIPGILLDKIDPMEVLFPNGSIELVKSLYESDTFRIMHQLTNFSFKSFFDLNKTIGKIKILEIGSGTGSTTKHILPLLKGLDVEYHFTDISPLFLKEAQNIFSEYDFISYKVIDIEKCLDKQGVTLNSYDLIIASNVLHATRDLKNTFSNVKQLLKNHGVLFMLEGTTPFLWIDLVFGITTGWWLFEDNYLRPNHALMSGAKWKDFLKNEKFSNIQIITPISGNDDVTGQSIIWAQKLIDDATESPLLVTLAQESNIIFDSFDQLIVDDNTTFGIDRPLLININSSLTDKPETDNLACNSLNLSRILNYINKDFKERLIILIACSKNATAYTGLWRVLQNECKNLDLRLVLFNDTNNLFQKVIAEVYHGVKDECSLWNGNDRKVLRLHKTSISTVSPLVEWSEKAVLITGGAGGIGHQLTNWLIEKGVSKVYITGRNNLIDVQVNSKKTIYISSDISEGVSDKIKDDLFAIFHLAGVVSDLPFWKQDLESYKNVLLPKVAGTDQILTYANKHKVKHVILFSSSACILGTIGQSNHALASSWLQYQSLLNNNLHVLSIAWGPWKGEGAVKKYRVDELGTRIGVSSTSPDSNFDLMEQLIDQQTTTRIVVKVDWELYCNNLKSTPYLSEVTDKIVFKAPENTLVKIIDFETVIKSKNEESLLFFLRGLLSSILGYKEVQNFDDESGFFDIGFDSLTILDLKSKLETITGLRIPITLAFKYPNIKSLISFIRDSYNDQITNAVYVEDNEVHSLNATSFIDDEFKNLFDHGTAFN